MGILSMLISHWQNRKDLRKKFRLHERTPSGSKTRKTPSASLAEAGVCCATRLPVIDLLIVSEIRVKESKGPLGHVWPCDIGIPSPGTREVWKPELYLPWIGFESTNAQLVCQAAVSSAGSDEHQPI